MRGGRSRPGHRAEASHHRRFQDIGLTAAGRALVPRLAALADQNDEETFQHLAPDEREPLVSTLKKLVAANKLDKIPIASGAAFDAAAVHLWTLRDGQVSQVHFLVDQPPMLAALTA